MKVDLQHSNIKNVKNISKNKKAMTKINPLKTL